MNFLDKPTLGQTTANTPMVLSIIEEKKPVVSFSPVWLVVLAVIGAGIYFASNEPESSKRISGR
jgi:hypothetical protein